MSTVVMTRQVAAMSPRLMARMAGALYCLEGTAAFLGQFFIRPRLVVSGDAATTANTILTHQPLYWLGFTLMLVAVVFHVSYTVLLYDLFRPVNRNFALLTAFFSLLACALQAFSSLFYLAPFLILKGGNYLNVFTLEQKRALALLFLDVNAQAFNIYILFFGIFLILIGYLIFRSTFLPWFIGVLLVLSGAGYLVLLSPPVADALYPFYLAPDAIGEPMLIIWLLVVGVNAQRWQDQAGATEASLRAG